MNNYNTISRKSDKAMLSPMGRMAKYQKHIVRLNAALERPNSHAGYTLVETLVAVMLLALTLSIMFQQFSGSMNAGRLSGDYTRAIWHAREKMNELQLMSSLTPGVRRGLLNDLYQWEATVVPHQPDSEAAVNDITPLSIQVRVTWRHGSQTKEMDIDTVVLRPGKAKG